MLATDARLGVVLVVLRTVEAERDWVVGFAVRARPVPTVVFIVRSAPAPAVRFAAAGAAAPAPELVPEPRRSAALGVTRDAAEAAAAAPDVDPALEGLRGGSGATTGFLYMLRGQPCFMCI